MSTGPIGRLVGVLRRGDVLPGPAPSAREADASDAGGHGAAELTTQSNLQEIAQVVPGLRDELVDRARTAGLLVCWVTVLAMPMWTVVDRVATPEQSGLFLVVRLLADVPMLLALWALWRRPLGRRRPEALTFVVMAILQVEIAWIITQAGDPKYHLLGFTLGIYGSGCIMVARPRWTGALVAWTWLTLGASTLAFPGRLGADDLLAATVFLGTASVIAVLAHLRRFAVNNRELVTRVRLEREQQRTGVLLAQLERLSHEDPLTGLANRRRWDAELASACADARSDAGVVAVVLLDVDRFKAVNDRHGHAGGDEVLRQVAGLLRTRVRGEDLVARLGGDELAVLMQGTDLVRAVEFAERLRAAAAALQPAGFGPDELSLSLGVAAVAGEDAYPLELMSRADEQLYRAKITRNAVGVPAREMPVPS